MPFRCQSILRIWWRQGNLRCTHGCIDALLKRLRNGFRSPVQICYTRRLLMQMNGLSLKLSIDQFKAFYGKGIEKLMSNQDANHRACLEI